MQYVFDTTSSKAPKHVFEEGLGSIREEVVMRLVPKYLTFDS